VKVVWGILTGFALTLVACSPAATPTTLETPTPTPTVTTPEPTMAAESDQQDSRSQQVELAEFAEGYVETANAALTDSAALTEWRGLFADSCGVCTNGYETAAAIQQAGQVIVGGELIDWTSSIRNESGDTGTIVISGAIAEAEVITTDGSSVNRYAEVRPVTVVYTAQRQPDGSWKMTSGQLVQ
jgi:hypothetical protein